MPAWLELMYLNDAGAFAALQRLAREFGPLPRTPESPAPPLPELEPR
jgi:hypothetical protein